MWRSRFGDSATRPGGMVSRHVGHLQAEGLYYSLRWGRGVARTSCAGLIR